MMANLWPWLLLLAVLAGLGAWWWRQRMLAATPPLQAGDRFSAVAALSPVQWDMLRYLNAAFPGRPVLFRVELSQLVAVRQAQTRLAAQRRLAEHVVDYVVCNKEGKAVYAFELDAAHEDPDEAALDATEKHRVLKTAGIRLIRLKRSSKRMPPPDEFRRHLRSAAIEPAATAPAPLEIARPVQDTVQLPPHDDDPTRPPATPDTEPMSLTGLMDLPPAADDGDPWGPTRRGG